jgi:Fic family protein
VLYLSRYINQSKTEYYRLLQEVRTEGNWEEWLLFMLEGIEQTSRQTIVLIQSIKDLMQEYKNKLRGELPKIYSQDLLNIIFSHPYKKAGFSIHVGLSLNFLQKNYTCQTRYGFNACLKS